MAKNFEIRNSTAEFLTFIAEGKENGVQVLYKDETIWATQKAMATLFDVGVPAISKHLKNIFESGELDKNTTISKMETVVNRGFRGESKEEVEFYNLDAIISVGYRVNSVRATQFRQCREIRLSERRFYQKLTDIYATAIDYNKSAPTTRLFYKKVQNKMHYAVHGHTAAELIVDRADAQKEHMGLTTWEKAPDGKIVKPDVSVAKNYLKENELEAMGRIVNSFLDIAEDMAKRHIPMTMEDWAKRIDKFLDITDRPILSDAGKVTAEYAKEFAETEFEKYRIIQDRLFKSDFDKLDDKDLPSLDFTPENS